jgi:MFS family permease
VDWTDKEAMRTPQFYILMAGYFANLICLVTVTSLSVSHLVERGVSDTMAGAMLSLEALVAVLARAGIGFLGDDFEPKYLMAGALGAVSLGCLMLALFETQPFLLFYALGTGIGFGATQLCCTVLMLNYFGQRHNLELFSTMCLVGAASALGPAIGGVLRDLTGSFVSIFLILSTISAVVCFAALAMRPPVRKPAAVAAVRAAPELPDALDAALLNDPI